MRVTLIHNEDAGDSRVSGHALVAALRQHGYDPVQRSSKESELQAALADPGELVVVAGGDGTVAAVAKHLAGQGVPMAIVPAGTANNIARSLGIPDDDDPAVHAARWATAQRQPFDVGLVSCPWGKRLFVESIGCGLFADMMVRFERRKESTPSSGGAVEELHDARTEMRRVLAEAKPRHWHVELDGHDMSGRYLLVEVMNISRIGPGIVLATDADSGDGMLDVVFVCDDPADRARLDAHLRQPATSDPEPPDLTVRRAREVVLGPRHDRVHLDDEAWPEDDNAASPGELRMRLDAGAVTMLS